MSATEDFNNLFIDTDSEGGKVSLPFGNSLSKNLPKLEKNPDSNKALQSWLNTQSNVSAEIESEKKKISVEQQKLYGKILEAFSYLRKLYEVKIITDKNGKESNTYEIRNGGQFLKEDLSNAFSTQSGGGILDFGKRLKDNIKGKIDKNMQKRKERKDAAKEAEDKVKEEQKQRDDQEKQNKMKELKQNIRDIIGKLKDQTHVIKAQKEPNDDKFLSKFKTIVEDYNKHGESIKNINENIRTYNTHMGLRNQPIITVTGKDLGDKEEVSEISFGTEQNVQAVGGRRRRRKGSKKSKKSKKSKASRSKGRRSRKASRRKSSKKSRK